MILVCHGVGGLVAKVAYLELIARPTHRFARLHHRLRGILFLATPHRGSHGDLEKLLELCHQGMPFNQDFKSGAHMIASINRRFARLCMDLPVVSLCETQPVNVSGKNIFFVEERNAHLGPPNEYLGRLDADHHNMCKYESPDSRNYQLVRISLAHLLTEARAKTNANS
jgi:hypothetical protein